MSLVQELMETSLGNLLTTQDAGTLVEKARSRTVHKGDCLFRAGDDGSSLFIIISGTFEVVLGQAGANATVVATVGRGQVVGELEVVTKTLRVATLSASSEATVLEISGDSLDGMLAENHPAATKIMIYIAKTLGRRLTAVNQRIIDKAPKPAPKPAPPPAAAGDAEPELIELDDADVIAIDDDDLDVLDKLWG